MLVLRALDIFFFVFHTGLVLFVVVGWAFRRTRLAHLVLVALVGVSWFGLGLWYGIGFCPCTEWHWRVREQLGYVEMPDSYLEFLFERLTGLDVSATAVDAVAFGSFLASACVSIVLNAARWKGKKTALPS